MTNLHDRRRTSTREALREVALARFARDGFANVTVAQLADDAGVTQRTFFRHFPTKEAVLFQDYETQLEWFAEALSRRPANESLFDAVLGSVVSFPHDLEVVRQAAILRATLLDGERTAGHLRVVQASFAEVLTDFVKRRHTDLPNVDLIAEVAGAALAAVLVAAVEHWGRDGCATDLREVVSTSIDLVRSGLAPLA
ncbi:TetR family transcriptional regulator [Mycobacterium crocinum]|uniref:TetR/AcrR family transcriptional regulator n=1 Tax=Mycolicibacterium crocinum TaxID=388459 RepID=A0ABY3TIR1_9MYCO|nr:TetR/AcrR family transcriptional regulator [Mycolicibacterium crocinum]APE14603.1 TetR family transcriptional regulator [Mycobacterium sp. WY10]MCV7217995.1 TetR family transcriptional regulator [Mycolicibacterium crocinum]ULN39631.1 TetR/AcrR family transcriptional regulator [Mycolicibacterium crocinum]